jgi:hypothetical protein
LKITVFGVIGRFKHQKVFFGLKTYFLEAKELIWMFRGIFVVSLNGMFALNLANFTLLIQAERLIEQI